MGDHRFEVWPPHPRERLGDQRRADGAEPPGPVAAGAVLGIVCGRVRHGRGDADQTQQGAEGGPRQRPARWCVKRTDEPDHGVFPGTA